MREIKFRAWDTIANEMILCKTMDDHLQGKRQINFVVLDYGYSGWEDNQFIFMQYTGLKDKNGKDLDWWEGDLIQDIDILYEIIFQWGAFWLKSIQTGHLVLAKDTITWDIKKVGNKYENKELLNERK